MMTHHRSIHHVVMESNMTWISYEHYIADVDNHVQNQRIFLFMSYFSLIFTSEIFCHLSNEHNSSCSNLLQSSCKSLDMLFVQWTSLLQNTEISSFVKELLLLFIITLWEKTQINPTIYCTYGGKKKWTQTFPNCNYGSKDMLFVKPTRTSCLSSKQALECQNLIPCQRNVIPLHHYTMKKNTNKSHHLLYLW
jgi:hypothetical protein